MKKSRGFTLIEFLVIVAVFVMLSAMLLPALNRSREKAKRILCLNRVRELNVAMHLYSADHKGIFPSGNNLEDWCNELFIENGPEEDNYIPEKNKFCCPSSRAKDPSLSAGKICGYAFVNGIKESDPADDLLLCDKPTWKTSEGELIFSKESSHKGDGANFCFVDGHVVWVPAENNIINSETTYPEDWQEPFSKDSFPTSVKNLVIK